MIFLGCDTQGQESHVLILQPDMQPGPNQLK